MCKAVKITLAQKETELPSNQNQVSVKQQTQLQQMLFQEKFQRSQNEQLFYIEWQKANNEKIQLNNVIAQLQSHITKLEGRLKLLEKREITLVPFTTSSACLSYISKSRRHFSRWFGLWNCLALQLNN